MTFDTLVPRTEPVECALARQTRGSAVDGRT